MGPSSLIRDGLFSLVVIISARYNVVQVDITLAKFKLVSFLPCFVDRSNIDLSFNLAVMLIVRHI